MREERPTLDDRDVPICVDASRRELRCVSSPISITPPAAFREPGRVLGQLEPLTLVIEAVRLALLLQPLTLRDPDERPEDAACEHFECFVDGHTAMMPSSPASRPTVTRASSSRAANGQQTSELAFAQPCGREASRAGKAA
jgi:hypothetical protein